MNPEPNQSSLPDILADPKTLATLGKYSFPVEVLGLDNQLLARGGLDHEGILQGTLLLSDSNTLDKANTHEVLLRTEKGDRRAVLSFWNNHHIQGWTYQVIR